MKSDQEKAEHLKKLLSTPFLDDLPDNLLKIRRNLLTVSFFSIALVVSNLKISGGSFLGLQIEGLDTGLITTILFYVSIYHLVHFLFQAADYVDRWRLRVTACAEADRPVRGDHNEDYSYDASQSTLYNWWEGMLYYLKDPNSIYNKLTNVVSELRSEIQIFKDNISQLDEGNAKHEANHIKNKLTELHNRVGAPTDHLKEIKNLLESDRIRMSLKNFDVWFWNYQWFQVARLILVEFLFPVVLGAFAIIFTSPFAPWITVLVLVCASLSVSILTVFFRFLAKFFNKINI